MANPRTSDPHPPFGCATVVSQRAVFINHLSSEPVGTSAVAHLRRQDRRHVRGLGGDRDQRGAAHHP
jgi:hypothetical protein